MILSKEEKEKSIIDIQSGSEKSTWLPQVAELHDLLLETNNKMDADILTITEINNAN